MVGVFEGTPPRGTSAPVTHTRALRTSVLKSSCAQFQCQCPPVKPKPRPPPGRSLALATLDSGAAWRKFKAICEAQGGLRTPPAAAGREVVVAPHGGRVAHFDNRRLSRVAKLAGAPAAPAAGLELHVHLGDRIEKGEPLYTIHAETRGELEYAREFAGNNGDIVRLDPES